MLLQDVDILLASMHKKESVISSPFKHYLNATIIVPDAFDTDRFGTFSGEIPRTGSPLETALLKAKTAAKEYGFQYILASEGTFTPHPAFSWLPANHELLLILNARDGEYDFEERLTTDTNFGQLHSSNLHTIDTFLKSIQFGSHAVNLIPEDQIHSIIKGVMDHQSLNYHIEKMIHQGIAFRIETDMRACHNPKRMENIRLLSEQFAKRLATICQSCAKSGFGKFKLGGSLPCELCQGETSLHAYSIEYCPHCLYETKKPREDGKLTSEQMYCYECNP